MALFSILHFYFFVCYLFLRLRIPEQRQVKKSLIIPEIRLYFDITFCVCSFCFCCWLWATNKLVTKKKVFSHWSFFLIATNFISPENNNRTIHEYNPTDLPKKVRSTHVPAGSYGNHHNNNSKYWTTSEKKSKAIPWGTQEVGEFLKTIGYEEFVPTFKDNVSFIIDIM